MINRKQIAFMQLSALGLLKPPIRSAKKSDVLQSIQNMGVLQIDTIHVVNRSPYLVLWSRLGNYDTTWLEQIHKEGELFEYWAHANCFIPINDYPIFRRLMLERATHWWDVNDWIQSHPEIITYVKNTIAEKGPQRSADFPKRSGKNNGWWDWKEEKIALDMLWTVGELMIPYRKNFQRYYDLQENIINQDFKKDIPDLETANRYLVEKTIQILGATRQKWIADYYRRKQNDVNRAVQELMEDKKILLVPSEDFPEGILVHSENTNLLDLVLNGKIEPSHTTILSPFDPLIWDRTRTKELFDFNYSLECYLPASKRIYGYFCLPILHNGQLVGRMDAKAHRKEKFFEIKSIHFEDWFVPDEVFFNQFSSALLNFSEWHHTSEIVLPESIDEKFSRLKDLLH